MLRSRRAFWAGGCAAFLSIRISGARFRLQFAGRRRQAFLQGAAGWCGLRMPLAEGWALVDLLSSRLCSMFLAEDVAVGPGPHQGYAGAILVPDQQPVAFDVAFP